MRTVYFFQNSAWSCLLLLVALSAQAQFTQLQKITPQAAKRQAGAIFGRRVATDADVMVVAAPDEPGGGAAYVFEKSGGTWTQTARLVSSAQATDGSFGFSVGVSGGTIVVGAYVKGDDANGENPLTQAGAAYVFEKSGSTWSQTQKLLPNVRAAGDFFGFSVGVSGGTIVVGSTGESQDASEGNTVSKAGAVYVFGKSGSIWAQTQKIVASIRGTSDQFGFSVGISGNTLVVGSPSEDEDLNEQNTLSAAGSAYVFEKSGSTWNQTQKIIASDRAAGDVFGYSASISGNILVVGAVQEDEDINGGNPFPNAGSAYVFEKSGNTWIQTQKLVPGVRAALDLFAWSVSVSGNTIVVGAPSESEDAGEANALGAAGSAYVFEKSGSTWSQTQKLVASDRAAADQFGYSVGVSGSTLVVGAVSEDEDASGLNTLTDAGSAYIFAASCARPTFGFSASGSSPLASASDASGSASLSVSLCAGGNLTLSGFSGTSGIKIQQVLTPSGSTVTYNGNPVGASTAVISPGGGQFDLPQYFGNVYGPYNLQSGSQGTLTQVYTPFVDIDNSGTLNTGDCVGDPITLVIQVNALPTVSFSGLAASYCANASAVTLRGSPSGGSFSGTGISGSTFSPATAGVGGPYTITYSYTDTNTGCSNSSRQQVSVIQPVFTQQPSLPPNLVVCANATVSFTFNVNCPTNASFQAELSNAQGTFSSGTQLLPEALTPGQSNTVTIPGLTAPTSALYRIRIVGSNPTIYSDPTGVVRINALEFNSNPTVNLVAVCVGSVIKVGFTVQGNCAFLPGNGFNAELSDASGSFASPLNLGSVTPGLNNVTIPLSVPTGTGYRVRVVSTAPVKISPVSAVFTINQPSFAGVPTVSLDNKCPGEAVRVSFAINCTFFGGNVFKVELSNAAGVFPGTVLPGAVTPGALNNVLIPAGTPAGTGYKLRIVSSNPALTSLASATIRVKACGTNREVAPDANGLRVVVSPNPSPEGKLRIAIGGAAGQGLRVELFNGTGLSIRQQVVNRAGEEESLEWDIARQPQGLYLLRVSGEKEFKTLKVMH